MSETNPQGNLLAPFTRLGHHESHPWHQMPWKGIWNKVLFFDRVTGATIELTRVEKGAEFPEHYHTTVQTLFLHAGRLRSRDRILTAGTFNMIPAGEVHGPFFAEEQALQFKYFSSVPVYILKDGHCFIYKEDGQLLDAGKTSLSKAVLSASNILR